VAETVRIATSVAGLFGQATELYAQGRYTGIEVVRLSGSTSRGGVDDDGLTREPPLIFVSGIGFNGDSGRNVLLGVDGPPGVGERLGVLVAGPTDGAPGCE
jgi:hypothetical protein